MDWLQAAVASRGFVLGPLPPPTPQTVLSTTVHLSAADLLALGGTPKEILPAPGAGKNYYVVGAFAKYNAGTVAYTVGNADNIFELVYGDALSAIKGFNESGPITTFIHTLTSTLVPLINVDNAELSLPIGNTDNAPISLQIEGTTPGLTLGDGTLDVTVLYVEFDT